ncbi:MAG: hypothetical protein ACKOZT_11400 [Cyanobium sp.]
MGKRSATILLPPELPFSDQPPAAACRSEILARLTLSVLERGSSDPGLWSEPTVHRALLVSGLSLLCAVLLRLEEERNRGPA